MNGRPQGSKTQNQTYISPAELKSLRVKVESLEKQIQEHLSEKNQWNSEIRSWQGSMIHVSLINGSGILGTLRWIDRYTICVESDLEGQGLKPIIVHKAAIAFLNQASEVAPQSNPDS